MYKGKDGLYHVMNDERKTLGEYGIKQDIQLLVTPKFNTGNKKVSGCHVSFAYVRS